MTGMLTSIRTASGRSSRSIARASRPLSGLEDAVAHPPQDLGQGLPALQVVLGDEDRPRGGGLDGDGARPVGLAQGQDRDGQGEGEGAAPARRAPQGDLPVQEGGQPSADGQAEPRPLARGVARGVQGRELVEDPLLVLGRDPDAAVLDGDADLVGRPLAEDADVAPIGVAQGVGEEVAEDLLELRAVGLQARRRPGRRAPCGRRSP